MTFGKPKQTNEKVRCLHCSKTYRDYDIILKSAGDIAGVEFFNDICPECGSVNTMEEEYAKMSKEEFKEKQKEENRKTEVGIVT